VTNQEKQNIVIRALMAMDALGVERVEIMPDSAHMGRRVMRQIVDQLKHTRVELLKMPYILGTQVDSTRAAALMAERDFACILVLGGDGTSRVVSQGCGEVPLMPISTGTNNVFPQMIEGTLAGMAAAALATGRVAPEQGCRRAPRLELFDGETLLDIALVDLACVGGVDIGARAVWEAERIHELFLTRSSPSSIGLSAIGGQLQTIDPYSSHALQVCLGGGAGDRQVTAPIAPGLMATVAVRQFRRLHAGQWAEIRSTPCVVALDGEREHCLKAGGRYRVRLSEAGPWVVDVDATLALAARQLNACAGLADPSAA
jgi:predicted polyphosphate/ATP-dependent NAD kinase